MKARYEQITPGGRLIAVSDLHGNSTILDRLLEKVGFGSSDTLVIDGDFIERGPDSLGTVRRAMRLAEGGNVFCTQGNGDYQILRAIFDNGQLYGQSLRSYLSWQKYSLALEMLRAVSPSFTNGDDPEPLLPLVREEFRRELAFLDGLPAMLRAGRFLFVHGGLTDPDPEVCAQGETWPLLKNDAYLLHACRSEYWQVVGHWPVTLYRDACPDCSPVVDRENRVICIDGGCALKPFAQLNALLVPDVSREDFSFDWVNELPVIPSPAAQAASERSISIKWPDNYVRVLERRDGLAHVERIPYGTRLWVPEEYLFESGDGLRVDDVTDYLLPVEKGEPVYLIKRTPGHLLCKKEDGRVGWILEEA